MVSNCNFMQWLLGKGLRSVITKLLPKNRTELVLFHQSFTILLPRCQVQPKLNIHLQGLQC